MRGATAIGRSVLVIEALAVSAALAGCGGGRPSAPASPTATASEDGRPSAPASPTATAPQDRRPPAAASPTATATDQGGDEQGIGVDLGVTITAAGIRTSRRTVDAFLPLRVRLRNRLPRSVGVRLTAAGAPVGSARPPAGGTATVRVEGLRPGSLTIRARGTVATVRVRRATS